MEVQSNLWYNDNPWDPKFVAVVDRWSLFGGGRLVRFDCNTFSKFTFFKV